MDNDRTAFEYIVPVTDVNSQPLYVQQGDGSDLIVQGMRPVTKVINHKYPTRYMSYLVEDLGTPLYSVKQHMAYQGCYFHAKNDLATLAFPAVTMELATEPEILFESVKGTFNDILSFDYQCAQQSTDHGTIKAKIVESKFYDNNLFDTKHQEKLGETAPIQLKSLDVIIPTRATSGSIGYDIHSLSALILHPGAVTPIPTGLACAIPTGM